MTYRNKRTGAVIEVSCPLQGPDWEEVKEAEEKPKTPKKTVKKG